MISKNQWLRIARPAIAALIVVGGGCQCEGPAVGSAFDAAPAPDRFVGTWRIDLAAIADGAGRARAEQLDRTLRVRFDPKGGLTLTFGPLERTGTWSAQGTAGGGLRITAAVQTPGGTRNDEIEASLDGDRLVLTPPGADPVVLRRDPQR